jgi:biotin biosynthesis protein BioC
MDKRLIAKRFSKAIATYPHEANVQRQIADKMIRLLKKHLSAPCPRVIEFGCGTGAYSRMLFRALRPEELFLNDLCPEMRLCVEDLLMEKQVFFLPGDAETASFPEENALITSCSALQWFESPENFFGKCGTLLGDQGYLAFSTFGKDNMKEIRELTGQGLPYRSREELETALSPRFDIVHSEEELIPLFFEGPVKVLYHLKQTGVNSLSKAWTRRDLLHFCERYVQEFAQGASVPLTYHPIYIIAKKKKV